MYRKSVLPSSANFQIQLEAELALISLNPTDKQQQLTR
jgi:hypothetical protein